LIQRVALVFVALLAFGAVALNAYEPSSELGSLRGSVMNMCRWWDAGCHARRAADQAREAARKAAEWALARKRELEAAAARAAALVKAAAERAAAAAREAAARDRMPKGTCKAPDAPSHVIKHNGYIYATMGNTNPHAAPSGDNDHGKEYLTPPEGWEWINYRDANQVRDARAVASSYRWGVKEVCFQPARRKDIEDGIKAANAAAGVAAGGCVLAAGAGGLAIAGGLGVLGAAGALAVGSGAGAAGAAVLALALPLAPVAGGLIVGAGLIGGAAVLIGAHFRNEEFVAACFHTGEKKWWHSKANYEKVKNGALDKQCGYADNGKLISFDHEKDYFGGANWIAPDVLFKSHQFLIRKVDPNPPKPTQQPTQAPSAIVDVPMVEEEELEKPPMKAVCPFKFTKSMNLMPPPGCIMFAAEDIGWDDYEGESQAALLCAVKNQGAVHITEEHLQDTYAKSFSAMSYLKVGASTFAHLYDNIDNKGKELVADPISKSFIHRKFPGTDKKINDAVKSLVFYSDFDVDAVDSCDDYIKWLKGDAPYKIPKLKGEDAVDRDPRDDVDDDDDKVKNAAGHEIKGDGKFVGEVPDDKEHDEEKRR
jgi:hypothetical protein